MFLKMRLQQGRHRGTAAAGHGLSVAHRDGARSLG